MVNDSLFSILRFIVICFAAAMLVKYFIFLIIAPFYEVKRLRHKLWVATNSIAKSYRPRVSVIVPAWNEEVGILRTVKSLLANDYPFIEIVVVNDGSTDNSHSVVLDFLKSPQTKRRHPQMRLTYAYKENGGKGSALNHGLDLAKGEIIVTMDADSIFKKDAIAQIVNYFADERIDALVGNVKIAKNHTLIGRIQQLEYLFGFYFKRTHCVMGAEYIYGGACSAFRRSKTFDDFGFFDTSNKTEDIEMSMRTRYFGLKSVYAEDVVCYTEGASTIRGLLHQRLRWKKGRFDTFGKYRSIFFSAERRHNKFLAWFILPYCLISEMQLLFEPIGIVLLTTYSILSGDYLSLALGIGFVFISYLVVGLFSNQGRHSGVLLWFPFTWPLFYFLVWVEYSVLIKSLYMIMRGKEVHWQQWERKGVALRELEHEF